MNTEQIKTLITESMEDIGWGVYWKDGYVIFDNKSPLGEDISFEFDYEDNFDENTIEDLYNYVFELYFYFNWQDHAVEWYNLHGEHGAPTDLEALLEDSQDVLKIYKELEHTVYNLLRKSQQNYM